MTCALVTWGPARPSAVVLAGTPGQPVSGRPVREAAVPEIVPDASAASATPAASRNGATSTAADRTASRRPLLTAAPWQAGRRNAGGGTVPWRPPGHVSARGGGQAGRCQTAVPQTIVRSAIAESLKMIEGTARPAVSQLQQNRLWIIACAGSVLAASGGERLDA